MGHLKPLLILCAIVALIQPRSLAATDPTVNAMLGTPSNASTDPQNKNDFLLIKKYYVVSYSDARGTPNWVSWQLVKEDLGDSPRKRVFDKDTTLPSGFRRIDTKEYAKSGFQRGHVCPHSDRAADQDMSYSTFIMTNIMPQAPNVNERGWEQLEEYERTLASEGNHIYISAGPAGQGGIGEDGPAKTIGYDQIVVPAKCWKIIVVVPPGEGDDLARISADTRVIAVLMPNENSVGYAWAKFRTSVSAIEKETGLNFFNRLPVDVAKALKEKVDTQPTPAPKPRHFGDENGGK
jgi:endonuclease G